MEITTLKKLNNFIENKKIKEYNALMNSIDKETLFAESYKKVHEILFKKLNERSDDEKQLLSLIRNIEKFEYNKNIVYSVPLPENDISKCYMEENGVKTSYYESSFKSFDKLKSKLEFENSLKKGFIYVGTYLDKSKSEGEILLNHIKLRKFINKLKYNSGLINVKYIETCGIEDGLVNIGLYIPIEWTYIYYKGDETITSTEIYSSGTEWIELAQKICKDFNLDSVLCKTPEEVDTYKIGENAKESVGIISNIEDFEKNLGKYDYFGFTDYDNFIDAMSLPGHILIR